MSTENIQLNNKEENREAVILIDSYTSAELSEIREMCSANDLNIQDLRTFM